MAHQDGADKGASGIARVGKRKWGYDPDQVDAFLDRAHALYESEDAHLTQQDIQNVSFDLSKGGYDITQVDAALSRLEQAVVDKQTTREITEHGRVAWKAQTEELYRQVCEHADRGTGERFARGHDRRPSYDRKQVDRLIDQIVDKAAAGLGVDGVSEQDVRKLADLNSGAVSNVVFTQRKGKNGYDERQVDYYLNSCVQLLSRLESFARVSDYVGGGHESGGSRRSSGARSASDAGVTPLFGADNAYAHAPSPARQEAEPQSFAPANESFHALHEAEEALFSSQTADEPSVAADAQSRLSASVHVLGRSLRPGAAVVVGGAVPAHRQKRELEQRERGSCHGSCPGAGDSVSGHPGGTGIIRPFARRGIRSAGRSRRAPGSRTRCQVREGFRGASCSRTRRCSLRAGPHAGLRSARGLRRPYRCQCRGPAVVRAVLVAVGERSRSCRRRCRADAIR